MEFEEELKMLINKIADSFEKRFEDKEDCDEEEGCEILQSLEDDYNDFLYWATGKVNTTCHKEEAKRVWKKRHPNLPIPRILMSEYSMSSVMSTICLLMDAYPLYLKSKNKVC